MAWTHHFPAADLNSRWAPLQRRQAASDDFLHAKAVEIGNRLLNSPSVQIVYADEVLFSEAWQYFSQHADKRYSLTDCVSFVVMTQQGIRALWITLHYPP